MGDPKFARKHYATPSHPWDGARISEEKQICRKYGLKNKRELWKTQTVLRDIRSQARDLQAKQRTEDEQSLKEVDQLIERLKRIGLLHGKADLNDILTLEVEALLSRRLQTQIYLKGLARSIKQARQLIVHGHISVDGRKVTVPSYLVMNTEAETIDYYNNSPFISDMHPERAAVDFSPEMSTVKDERRLAANKERDMRRSRELDRIERMRRAIAGPPKDEEKDKEGEEGKSDEAAPEGAEAKKDEASAEEKKAEAPVEKKAEAPVEKKAEAPVEKKADEKKPEGGDS